ncbi:M20/M25/M40 family metallo-hydrolase [Corynebacterium liangguodongii]|uniref:Dipeptidase n=1 Tax=Corynebacterium liangguodongii TaxID=2079535 RepID=A0A2S0WFY5_9CORY|nr:M20/M25/M40 family metallo-hydrolase [Corynebacterium liangguodongii]AWB84681.1 dipeptidase [Corynebacterium liangguodongii]PWB99689.1 dipeptidase [Corynebacterium liangguodongii]
MEKPNRDRIFADLSSLVSFNSPHSVPELAEQHDAACAWVCEALEGQGFEVTRHATVDNADAIIARRHIADNAPTVLLYSHYDVVPANNPEEWTSDPFTLTERDGRWYGRGAADCKGNIAMHLEALRLAEPKANITVVVEGSEELGGNGGLERLIEASPELFAADAILIADTGNVAAGTPTLTTQLRGGAQVRVDVQTLEGDAHSGNFGGAAPDAAAALIHIARSLFDDHGRTTIDGVNCLGTWEGDAYDRETFRKDAGVLEGVQLYGTVDDEPADMVWARPAVTMIGFTSRPVDEALNAVNSHASAQFNLRVPAGMSAAETAAKLEEHINANTPWGAQVDIEVTQINEPFATDITGPAITLFGECLRESYGADSLAVVGSGGSIPLTITLQDNVPGAEIVLFGVEEPQCGIHGVDESVDPTEIERIALAEAEFLTRFGA